MSTCVIFGGSGFVGTHLAIHFLQTGRFTHVHLADIRPSTLEGTPGISTSHTDVRQAIPAALIGQRPEWIFNLAAVHREPGHRRSEYFETNLNGARNVCAFADATGCANVFFTSSISVYGPTFGPTDENAPVQPATPYGASKFPAELIHEAWKWSAGNRRLIITRPGVLYGPGDPGNILRMIRAVKKGYFAYPGSPRICKSYGYIYGFIDSIDFVMDSSLDFLRYNYVETPTDTLGELVGIIKNHFGARAFTIPIPMMFLTPVARAIHALMGNKSPIHPVRVRKAAMSTHIIPRALIELGFNFAYPFARSLEHWQAIAPEDFGIAPKSYKNSRARLTLTRPAEKTATMPHRKIRVHSTPSKSEKAVF